MRQYSLHSRESIVLARNPFAIPEDHLVVLWSKGGAIVHLYPIGGRIYGRSREPWTHSKSDGDPEVSFESPVRRLRASRKTLVGFLKQQVGEPANVETAPGELYGSDPYNSAIRGIALFTRPVTELSFDESERDTSFIAMTLEHATARTIVHLPNLLRVINSDSTLFSVGELVQLADALGDESERNSAARTSSADQESELLRIRKQLSGSRSKLWPILSAVVAALLILGLYFAFRSDPNNPPQPPVDSTGQHSSATPGARAVPEAKVVIQLPNEIQLFISPDQYATRSQLDQAIAHGQGRRFLPATTQEVWLDSVQFARGVYGYFKVDNAWRKGKLLQTFNPRDTFKIDNFLPPLP